MVSTGSSIEVIPTHHGLHSLKVPTILNVLMTSRMGEELWRIKETMFNGDEEMHRAMVHLADIHASGNIDVTCQTEPDANFVKQNYSGKWKELPASEKQGYKDRASTMFPQNTVERLTDRQFGHQKKKLLGQYTKLLKDMGQHGKNAAKNAKCISKFRGLDPNVQMPFHFGMQELRKPSLKQDRVVLEKVLLKQLNVTLESMSETPLLKWPRELYSGLFQPVKMVGWPTKVTGFRLLSAKDVLLVTKAISDGSLKFLPQITTNVE
ncbi:hypothetical protein DYB25_003735 [Aphanomyces astaci]|uniref:Uncharacterized protein n=1 Tax=Aphanomyces astaci TaxID=112090 RepID=A0A397BF96_APHAT|nr:hypothetical protein DYB36_009852 [Aphanomyces astaci]RHY22330.1 hypothetical protein DYB25_003735 [Aphanomyces astaci]RHY76795.1 hypothetical protein DYB30_011129 [Aphanomyces astaci]